MKKFSFNKKEEMSVEVYNLSHCSNKGGYYNKAEVIETPYHYFLRSYKTIVCGIDRATNTFQRYWGGESAPTMKHINSFLRDFNISGGGVHWWRNQAIIDPSKTEFDIADKIADNATFNATYY